MMPEQPSSQTQDVQPNLGGRPAFYTDPDVLDKAIDSYFEYCEVQCKPPTKVGLALHLGFADRQSLRDYKLSENTAYSCCIKKAETKIERYLAERVVLGKGSTPGTIFTLKAMHGWQETSVVEHHHEVTPSIDQLTQLARSLLAQASPEQLRVLGVDKTDNVIDVKALPDPAQAKVDR